MQPVLNVKGIQNGVEEEVERPAANQVLMDRVAEHGENKQKEKNPGPVSLGQWFTSYFSRIQALHGSCRSCRKQVPALPANRLVALEGNVGAVPGKQPPAAFRERID